jgi:aminoglycoside phosphotransferase (APT) family kinase protein
MTTNRVRAGTADVAAHPAVQAWLAVTGSGRLPRSVVVVRDRPSPHKGVYRLAGVGDRDTAVFAKRAPDSQILLQRRIHEQLLPFLGVTVPAYYGSCLEPPDGWLFLEDVGDARYSRTEPAHLSAVARWVGALHTAAARLDSVPSLPDAGPSRYLEQLRAAHAKVHVALGRWTFPRAEVEVLAAVLAWCDALEDRWPLVEDGCAGAPSTLVHGDFQPKNAFLRGDDHDPRVLPIDWELAGWGPPAIDLTKIDVATYWQTVREGWPSVDYETVERLARVGRVLEAVGAVDRESEALRLERADDRSEAVANLAPILDQLIHAARAAQVTE